MQNSRFFIIFYKSYFVDFIYNTSTIPINTNIQIPEIRNHIAIPVFSAIGLPISRPNGIVTEDTTVCLVEVMKTFNEIKAGAKGKITNIHVENEDFVNPGDVLFTIS